MDMLQGKKLVMKDCQSYKTSYYLKKCKIVIYYFSASWVDDINLLKKLKAIYAENQKRQLGMEVIYVSSDLEEKPFSKYFREHHGPWPGISPQNTVLSEELRQRYNITCLPQIVVVRKDDSFVITRRGKEELEKFGINVLVAWTDYDPDVTTELDDDLFVLKPENKAEVDSLQMKVDHKDSQSTVQLQQKRTRKSNTGTDNNDDDEGDEGDEDDVEVEEENDDFSSSKILSFASGGLSRSNKN